MADWKNVLDGVDDDYLIGLSNKGIVKRAYKDMESGGTERETALCESGETLQFKTGEEEVVLRIPLGESTCSCPSKSVCRHIVQAILTAKLKFTDDKKETEEEASSEEVSSGEVSSPKISESNGKKAEAVSSLLWEEIETYPKEKLLKVLTGRKSQRFINQVLAETKPEIINTSIVTVKLPENEAVVKLISPLDYSTCTCHKKELCEHKAKAILWCQLEKGFLHQEELLEKTKEQTVLDMELVRRTALQMREFLEELLAVGLSRSSLDVLDSLERLAIMGHQAGLAKFEGYFRTLQDSYSRYFRRAAGFQLETLYSQIMRLYSRTELLIKAETPFEAAELAGEFRSEYMPVGNLELIGVAGERFESQSGYAGETVYFLEPKQKKWYTYTNARPVFYENSGNNNRSHNVPSPSPWGLSCSFFELASRRIRLSGAKANLSGRLSASQDTRAQLLGTRELEMEEISNWYYEDFKELFQKCIRDGQREWLQEQAVERKLVFLQPDGVSSGEFASVSQKFEMILFDRAGREVIVEMKYSRIDRDNIRYMEQTAKKMAKGKGNFLFLGKVYLQEGRIRMYPIEIFPSWKG